MTLRTTSRVSLVKAADAGGHSDRHRIFVDSTLAAEPQIVFNGGTHHDVIAMRYQDFALIVRPVVGSFAMGSISRREPAECG